MVKSDFGKQKSNFCHWEILPFEYVPGKDENDKNTVDPNAPVFDT